MKLQIYLSIADLEANMNNKCTHYFFLQKEKPDWIARENSLFECNDFLIKMKYFCTLSIIYIL